MAQIDTISAEHDALYTSTQAAFICRVAPRTVNKWFDSGRLSGYTLPGTATRRIPALALRRFLHTYGMYAEWERFVDRKREAGEEVKELTTIGFKAPTQVGSETVEADGE